MSHWSWQTSNKWLRSEARISVEMTFPSRSVIRSQILPNGNPVTWLLRSPNHLLSFTNFSARIFTGILTAACLARYLIKVGRFLCPAVSPLHCFISTDSADFSNRCTRTNWFVIVYLIEVLVPLCLALGLERHLPMTTALFHAQCGELACRPTLFSESLLTSRTAS